MKLVTIKSKKIGKKGIGTNAFTGTVKKCQVKVPKAKKKAYTKLLKKCGLSKKAKIKAF